ncbi:hypothetical protein LLG95_08890 [bacterium]|nr:hypothetical protein [bacterium]
MNLPAHRQAAARGAAQDRALMIIRNRPGRPVGLPSNSTAARACGGRGRIVGMRRPQRGAHDGKRFSVDFALMIM